MIWRLPSSVGPLSGRALTERGCRTIAACGMKGRQFNSRWRSLLSCCLILHEDQPTYHQPIAYRTSSPHRRDGAANTAPSNELGPTHARRASMHRICIHLHRDASRPPLQLIWNHSLQTTCPHQWPLTQWRSRHHSGSITTMAVASGSIMTSRSCASNAAPHSGPPSAAPPTAAYSGRFHWPPRRTP